MSKADPGADQFNGVEAQLELQQHWAKLLADEGLGVVYAEGFFLAEGLSEQERNELDTLLTGREHEEPLYPEEAE
jgi:hypothetical protein